MIEQAIGALKMGFPMIKEPVRLSVRNIHKVYMACVLLHNFLIQLGMGFFEDMGDATGL